MTLIRKLALKISNTVVRYASPGSKEWAEGLSREVAFIPGDWAALVWALGSLRVLFDYREAPLVSLTDLPDVAEKFAQLSSGNAIWVSGATSFLWALLFGVELFRATNGLERFGCIMAILGWTSLGIFTLIHWRHKSTVPPPDDVPAVIQFYVAELKRSRYTSWIAISAITFLCVGMVLASPWFGLGCYLLWGLVGLFWATVTLAAVQQRRINRRRLERLKALDMSILGS